MVPCGTLSGMPVLSVSTTESFWFVASFNIQHIVSDVSFTVGETYRGHVEPPGNRLRQEASTISPNSP